MKDSVGITSHVDSVKGTLRLLNIFSFSLKQYSCSLLIWCQLKLKKNVNFLINNFILLGKHFIHRGKYVQVKLRMDGWKNERICKVSAVLDEQEHPVSVLDLDFLLDSNLHCVLLPRVCVPAVVLLLNFRWCCSWIQLLNLGLKCLYWLCTHKQFLKKSSGPQRWGAQPAAGMAEGVSLSSAAAAERTERLQEPKTRNQLEHSGTLRVKEQSLPRERRFLEMTWNAPAVIVTLDPSMTV